MFTKRLMWIYTIVIIVLKSPSKLWSPWCVGKKHDVYFGFLSSPLLEETLESSRKENIRPASYQKTMGTLVLPVDVNNIATHDGFFITKITTYSIIMTVTCVH